MQTIDEVKKHCREVGEGIVAAVAAAVVAFTAVAATTNKTVTVPSHGKQVAGAKPELKRMPESEAEHSKREHENRLKMILLSFGGEANTNNITFSDLDLTGWETEEKKGEEALMLFLEKVWERADAKKIAEKRKCSKGRARLTK